MSSGLASPFYADTVELDEKTGLPEDYHSFFAAYKPLLIATAARVKIPEQDREDAAQEVAIKFWLKEGLDLYDTTKKTRFATLLRNWAGRFMLQERDKVIKAQRNTPFDPIIIRTDGRHANVRDVISSAEEIVISDNLVSDWQQSAETALETAGKQYLVPVLRACVRASERGTAPSRAEIAEAANCKISRATKLLQELRATLTAAGCGADSLRA